MLNRSRDPGDGQLYLDAKNEKERKVTVTTTGIWWSDLYRLPYFDPSCMVVVDCMHNLFLGLVQEHFEKIGRACVGKEC